MRLSVIALCASLLIIVLCLSLLSCNGDPPSDPAKVVTRGGLTFAYNDVAAAMGFVLRNRSGRDTSKEFILEAMPPGIAVADFDGDGWMDLYCPNGNNIVSYDPKTKVWTLLDPDEAPRNELYWNKLGKRFEPGARAAGVDDDSWSFGVVAGDIDNDGDADLYLCNWGANRLYLNSGDGTFEEVALQVGAAGNPRDWSCGACFFDYDKDGDLDIYVAQYLDMDLLAESDTMTFGANGKFFGRQCDFRGIPVYCGPLGLEPLNDFLLKNELQETGKLRFTDVTKEAGLILEPSLQRRNESSRGPYYGFQPVAWDIDGDGWQDVFVANDSVANLAWINKGNGTFVDRALELTLAVSQRDFAAQASMGVAIGDINRDGLQDVTVTEFSHDHFNLMICQALQGGGVVFNERAVKSGLRQMTFAKLGWGALLFDPDLDGDDDIFYACAHVYPKVDDAPTSGTTYRQTNMLILNEDPQKMRFRDVSDLAGPGMQLQRASRAAAQIDFDNDGDPDIAINELNDKPTLLRCDQNAEGAARHWIRILLRGDPKNGVPLDPAGARVTVVTGDVRQTKILTLGSSFLSSEDPRLLFGLADKKVVDSIEILWPNGRKLHLESVEADRVVTIDYDVTPSGN